MEFIKIFINTESLAFEADSVIQVCLCLMIVCFVVDRVFSVISKYYH